jgi:hypothetical protein
MVRRSPIHIFVSPSVCISGGKYQENAVGEPYPNPNLRHKEHDGKKDAHSNPTRNGPANHKNFLTWSVRVLDAEVSAEQPAGYSD